MICLSLDTTLSACTVAIVTPARILASRSDVIGRGHAAHLAPMVAELMSEAGVSAKDLSRISVCTGPGSFTGQRVALSLAKGLALPHKTPVLGFSCFDVWAYEADPAKEMSLLTVADVRRNQLCWAHYNKGVLSLCPRTEMADKAKENFKHIQFDKRIDDAPISGPVLGWLGLDKAPQKYPAHPLYSRPPDAKLPGGIDPLKI